MVTVERARARWLGAGLVALSVAVGGCSAGATARTSMGARTASPPVVRTEPTATPQPRASAPNSASLPADTKQLITVTAASSSATTAAYAAYQNENGQWVRVFGPWTAHLGSHGLAAPGAKREGDLTTPSGTYGFQFMFGVQPDPGVKFTYRQASSYDKWDDDPSSPRYNEWVDERSQDPGASPENMTATPFYDYGAVIAYNTARTPGLGSAIFMHVDTGAPTTGCVTIPRDELLQVLRWMDPAQHPEIDLRVA